MTANKGTCMGCANAELHGLSRVAERNGWPVTVSMYCPVKAEHCDFDAKACSSYVEGEPHKVYDDVDGF